MKRVWSAVVVYLMLCACVVQTEQLEGLPGPPGEPGEKGSSGETGEMGPAVDTSDFMLATADTGTTGSLSVGGNVTVGSTGVDPPLLVLGSNAALGTLIALHHLDAPAGWEIRQHMSGDIRLTVADSGVHELNLDTTGNLTITGDYFSTTCGTPCAPDYVFEEDYPLMPLDDVAQYIAHYKHLPGVPSEAEVKRDGLNLRAHQMVLLEKIEELVLYTIDQERRIAKLEKTVAALQAK